MRHRRVREQQGAGRPWFLISVRRPIRRCCQIGSRHDCVVPNDSSPWKTYPETSSSSCSISVLQFLIHSSAPCINRHSRGLNTATLLESLDAFQTRMLGNLQVSVCAPSPPNNNTSTRTTTTRTRSRLLLTNLKTGVIKLILV